MDTPKGGHRHVHTHTYATKDIYTHTHTQERSHTGCIFYSESSCNTTNKIIILGMLLQQQLKKKVSDFKLDRFEAFVLVSMLISNVNSGCWSHMRVLSCSLDAARGERRSMSLPHGSLPTCPTHTLTYLPSTGVSKWHHTTLWLTHNNAPSLYIITWRRVFSFGVTHSILIIMNGSWRLWFTWESGVVCNYKKTENTLTCVAQVLLPCHWGQELAVQCPFIEIIVPFRMPYRGENLQV